MRILLADDHQVLSDGLCDLLARQTEHVVLATAASGLRAVELAAELEPDAVILDIAMPDLNGIEAARHILRHRPQTKVLGLSMHADRRFVREMLKAGATAYLLKESAFDEVVRALDAVAKGQVFLSPAVAATLVGDLLDRTNPAAAASPQPAAFQLLTDRERQVLQLIAEGHPTGDIAKTLFVSVKTIETQRRSILQKTGARGIADLTRYAIREGIITL
jgi:DNA-binding NarL/FixJ family response regulator